MDYARELLKKVLTVGYRSEHLMTDTTWNIPIELKWEIENLFEVEKTQKEKPE